MKTSKSPILVGATVAAAVAFALWWRVREGVADGANPGYVGREVCAACHATETARWTGSHHDKAMQEATPETVLGDFDDAEFTHLSDTSLFHRQDGKFYARTEGPDGAVADFEIVYTFGVTPLQQYLVAFPGGRYQALSIAWDSRTPEEGGQRWFHLYGDTPVGPDDALHWTRPSQNWNSVCAECHSTNLRKGFDLTSRSYETTWSEIDVSCEACHGPGSAHVGIAETAAPKGSGVSALDWGLVAALGDENRTWTFQPGATIATPSAPRSSNQQIDTCAQCHSRRSTIEQGRVAGRPLFDTHVVSLLRDDLYFADGQIRDEVYVYGSFVQSRMYRAGVTCSDCHDPHGLNTRAEGNALCSQCHVASYYDAPSHHFHESGSTGGQCVECHMPATTYMQVDPRRDHGIRIPRPDLSETIGVPNACTGCHTDQTNTWAAQVIVRWYGPRDTSAQVGEVMDAGRRSVPAAGDLLAALARDTAQPAITRASALALLPPYPPNITVRAIQAGLADTDPLVRMGALHAAEALPPSGLMALVYPVVGDSVRSVRMEAARLLAPLTRTSLAPEQASDIERVTAEYENAQRVNADHPGSWVNLGNLQLGQGRLADAETSFRTAIDLDPTFVVAHLNLADLLRVSGRDELGAEVLRDALGLLPDTPELQYAVGLSEVRRGNTPAALEWLEGAVRGAPGNARFVYVYGVALASSGAMAPALRVLETALLEHPYDRDLLAGLAAYRRDLGDMEAAIGYASRLLEVVPDDPGARQLLTQLRSAR